MNGRAPSTNFVTKFKDADVLRDAVNLKLGFSYSLRLGGT
jgi:hypothetical protein